MAIIPVKNLTTQDILYGDRTTEYRWEVLEHSNGIDYLVGTLDGVSEGSLAWVQNAAVKGRGRMEVIDLPAAAPGMLRVGELSLETCRIRPVMTLNGADQTGSYEDVWVEERRNRYIPAGIGFGVSSGSTTVLIGPYSGGYLPVTPGEKISIKSSGAEGNRRQYVFTSTVPTSGGLTLTGVVNLGNGDGLEAVDITVPEGAAYMVIYVSNLGTGTRVIAISSSPEASLEYFDGSTASPVPYRRYRWLGAVNASQSVAEIRTQEWVSSGESVIPEIPWGTFLLEKATEDWEDTGRVWKLSLLDRATVPSQDAVDQSYAVAAGTNILKEVRAILATSGEYMAIDESVDLATRSGMVWEAGTSKLNIINDLLDSAGYNSLWMDGWGNFQATPRVLPADRSIIYELLGFPRELSDGEKSIYRPEWTRERDSFRVPNKVIAVQAAGGEDEEALVGQWTNEDPASPYSYPSRGRWIPHVLDSVDCPEGTEAEILAFLEARARATLIQMSAVQAEVKIEHLPIPVRVGDVLRFANTRAGIDTRHTITRLDLDTSPTGLMKSTLQEVISL